MPSLYQMKITKAVTCKTCEKKRKENKESENGQKRKMNIFLSYNMHGNKISHRCLCVTTNMMLLEYNEHEDRNTRNNFPI